MKNKLLWGEQVERFRLKLKRKLGGQSGFTLVEMLCAVVILLLLCLMLETGLNMAMHTYRDLTAASEMELLLNSLSNAMTDKLRFALVTVDSTGANPPKCSIGNIEKDLVGPEQKDLQNLVRVSDGMVMIGDDKKLLPDGAYGEKTASGRRYAVENLKVNLSESPVVGGAAVFTVELEVQETSNSGTINAETELTVRSLNPVRSE